MKLTKMITRSSIALLALCSTSAFAGAHVDIGPDFTLHKATVNMKLTYSKLGDKIQKETVKTKDVIDLLGGDSDNKGQVLALAVPCDIDDPDIIDPDVFALMVVDKNYEAWVPTTDVIILPWETIAIEFKDGDPKKADIVAETFGPDVSIKYDVVHLIMSGTTKFGKIGKNVAEDNPLWDKDDVCAKTIKSKSVTGHFEQIADPFDDINVMSGKIEGGKAKAGLECDSLVDQIGFKGLCVPFIP
jgi:hypothetical protein